MAPAELPRARGLPGPSGTAARAPRSALRTALGVALAALLALAAGAALAWHRADELARTRAEYLLHDLLVPAGDARALVLGSSSARRLGDGRALGCGPWLNRGIGTASVPDLLDWLGSTPLAAAPGRVLLYAGENDLARGAPVERAARDHERLVRALLERFDAATIHVLGVKPSPARRAHRPRFEALNAAVAAAWEGHDRVRVHRAEWPSGAALTESGLFLDDGVHLTPAGYERLTRPFRETCQR